MRKVKYVKINVMWFHRNDLGTYGPSSLIWIKSNRFGKQNSLSVGNILYILVLNLKICIIIVYPHFDVGILSDACALKRAGRGTPGAARAALVQYLQARVHWLMLLDINLRFSQFEKNN